MEIIDILNKWAKFSNYDPNQSRFNLGTHWIHEGNNTVAKLKNYDNSGALSLLYAKELCKKVLCAYRPESLFGLIEDPSDYEEAKEMWETFNNPLVRSIEEGFKGMINNIIDKASAGRLIGNEQTEIRIETLLSALSIVVDSLGKCTFDVFAKGQCSQTGVSFNTHVHIFETCEDCLMALNKAPDSIYLCYISHNNSAYGYFGFFVKDGFNIYALTERIDEIYPGQNAHKRNYSDTESKKYKLFPYSQMIKCKDRDYKGYASRYIVDDSNRAIFTFGIEGYLPVIVAMYLIHKSYCGKVPEGKLSYIHSVALKIKAAELSSGSEVSENSLILLQSDTALACTYKHNPITPFDKSKFLVGGYSEEFGQKAEGDTYLDYGIFRNENQYLVELYGKDFDERYLTAEDLNNPTLLPTDSSSQSITFLETMSKNEIIGSEKRIRLTQYWWSRKALAKHITLKMREEFKKFGYRENVHKWYENAVRSNMDYIYKVLLRTTTDNENNNAKFILTEGAYPSCKFGIELIINSTHPDNKYKCLCPVTNTLVSHFFTFKPNDWQDIAYILNINEKELPLIIKGWKYSYKYSGNSILDMIDPVSMVSHVLSQSLNYYAFTFSIGLSKRGYNQLCKKYNVAPKILA